MNSERYTDATWFKSSRSNATGACVEVAFLDSQVAMRDSKQDGTGPVLVFGSARREWFKSSRSNATGACVEVAFLDSQVAMRDSKQDGTGPVLVFGSAHWGAFVRGVRG